MKSVYNFRRKLSSRTRICLAFAALGIGILTAWRAISITPNYRYHLPTLTTIFERPPSPGELNLTLAEYLRSERIDTQLPVFVTLINGYYVKNIESFVSSIRRLGVGNRVLVICSTDECQEMLEGKPGFMVFNGYHRNAPLALQPPTGNNVNQLVGHRAGLLPWIKFNRERNISPPGDVLPAPSKNHLSLCLDEIMNLIR